MFYFIDDGFKLVRENSLSIVKNYHYSESKPHNGASGEPIEIFFRIVPHKLIKYILGLINNNLCKTDSKVCELTEFLEYLGVWIILAIEYTPQFHLGINRYIDLYSASL